MASSNNFSWVRNSKYLDPYNLTGRVAVVTGGGSGIGKTCSEALLSVGATVVITGRREEKLKEAVSDLSSVSESIEYYVLDVTDEDAVKKAAESLRDKHGKVDILVNNAGIHRARDESGFISSKDFDDIMKTNIYGVHYCMEAFLPVMPNEETSAVVNIGSISALVVNLPQMQGVYNASKGGMHQLAQSNAVEWAHRGYKIRVNTVAPGYIRTEMTEKLMETDPDLVQTWIKKIPLRRVGSTTEVASLMLFLASPLASYITGSTYVVDGGYTCV